MFHAPFYKQPCGTHSYELGNKVLEVPADTVKSFKECNTKDDMKGVDHENRFVHALLLLLSIEIEKITVDSIEPEDMDYMNSNYLSTFFLIKY